MCLAEFSEVITHKNLKIETHHFLMGNTFLKEIAKQNSRSDPRVEKLQNTHPRLKLGFLCSC